MYLTASRRKEINSILIELYSEKTELIELHDKEKDIDKLISIQNKLGLIENKIEFNKNRIINKPKNPKYREKIGVIYL